MWFHISTNLWLERRDNRKLLRKWLTNLLTPTVYNRDRGHQWHCVEFLRTIQWKSIDNCCRQDKRNICMFLDSRSLIQSLSLWLWSCVDWPGFSLVFYTKIELIKHFLQNEFVSEFLHYVLEILCSHLGMVVYACNPSIWEVWAGPSEFTGTLSYILSSRATGLQENQ